MKQSVLETKRRFGLGVLHRDFSDFKSCHLQPEQPSQDEQHVTEVQKSF